MELDRKLEADCRLLKYKNYEDYLDSMVTLMDKCVLPSRVVSRHLAELGYRSSGDTLSREDFERRRNAVRLYLHPPYSSFTMVSTGSTFLDATQRELALRERPNRIGILSTIIFIRHVAAGGIEISGYIDYAQELKRRDWDDFFKKQVVIMPTPNDLGYYHWRNEFMTTNDSENYKVIVCGDRWMMFENKNDRKLIYTDPSADPGHNTCRKRIKSKMCQHFILFDHFVRRRR